MNQQTRSEQRRYSELESTALFGLLQEASVQAIFAGIQPTEVWLGPKEALILEVEMNWQEQEGRLRHTNANQSAMIRGDMEGAKLMGLRVRLMVKDGVRVGISWPNDQVVAPPLQDSAST
jgi:hypothetical protein